MSRSSPIYSPRLTRHQTRQVLLATTLVTFTRHHTRRVASYSLSSSPPVSSSTSYLSRRIVHLPAVCPSASCANNVTKLADLLAASYSPSYTSSLTRLHTRRVVSYLVSSSPPISSSTSYSSRRIVQLSTVCPSESCANHFTKLAIILVASYSLLSLVPLFLTRAERCYPR